MKRLNTFSAAAIGFAILFGLIPLGRAQAQATNTNDTNRNAAKRQSKRSGSNPSLAGSDVSANGSAFNITPLAAGPNLPVLGSGTLGRLTKWTGLTGSNSFAGDSTIFEDKYGMVGIGTDSPTSKLTVAGMVQITLGGLKFPDGTVQTTADQGSVFHNATLMGNGTAGSPIGVALPLTLSGAHGSALLTVTNTNSSPGSSAVLATGGDSNSADVIPGSGIVGNNNEHASEFQMGGVGVRGTSGDAAELFSISGAGIRGQGGTAGDCNGLCYGGDGVEAYGGDASKIGTGGAGVVAIGGVGSGVGETGGTGIYAAGGVTTFGSGATMGLAGYFSGSVEVLGDFNVTGGGTKNFKIDHPLDPENKYLYHAAVESSEVLNIYSGNITTDESGDAVVTLPDWFEAVNRDFRYQLTVVGTFAQAIVADEVKSNHFKIRTSAPGVKVSWQVTGVRSDAAILKHPFKVEEDKPKSERGSYLSPEAYDQPKELGVEWARHPQMMQQLEQRRVEAEQKLKPHKTIDR